MDFNLSVRDLCREGSSSLPYRINWTNNNNEPNFITFPKKLTGTEANVLILCSDNFPTGSSNDGAAFFAVKKAIETNRVINNTLEFCVVDNAIPSFAWACAQFGLKCIIRTPQLTHRYFLKKALSYGAKIIHEGVKYIDVVKIAKNHSNKKNFISQYECFESYIYHSIVTSYYANKAVSTKGNNKLIICSYPSSSGALTGAASALKKIYPYSKNLAAEPSKAAILNGARKSKELFHGFGVPYIPLIHNVLGTDYAVSINETETIKVLKCIEDYDNKIIEAYNIDSREIKSLKNKIGLSTIACLIGIINLAKQLYLKQDDNVLVISEDTSAPYLDLLKREIIEDIDVKHIIDEAFVDSPFRRILDITGQRQRERVFKNKNYFWLEKGVPNMTLERMKNQEYWESILI
jgi:cysteine synthase